MKYIKQFILGCLLLVTSLAVFGQQVSKVTYIHSDPDGTPFAATDSAGNVAWTVEHFPFGREFEDTSVNRNGDISFAGKPYDEEIGLSYFGGRWYDPELGRFMSIDPVSAMPEDYQTFNRYAYGFNNPYKYSDPDGNFAFLIPIAIFVAKEIAAEAASRATGGATDFLSVRRGGTKLIKSGISRLNKGKANNLGGGGKGGGNGNGGGNGGGGDGGDGGDFGNSRKLFHFTDEAGAKAIKDSGVIKPDSKGRVFVTKDKVPASEANNALFMGRGGTKGSHRVEIEFKSDIKLNRGTQPNELIHTGAIRNGRQGNLKVKKNDFK